MKQINFDDLEWDDDQCAVIDGVPFTGEAVESTLDGSVVGRFQYRDGLRSGEEQRFTPDGQMLYQGLWQHGMGVGVHRSWYANGQRKEEAFYDENGFLVKVDRWARDGSRVG